MNYNYDEHSQTWPVFALALTSVVVVPVTVKTLFFSAPETSPSASANGAIPHTLEPAVAEFRKKQRSKSLFSKKNLLLVAGWLVMAALVYTIRNTETVSVGDVFDPYTILGVEFGATEKEVKSVYKKLSVKFHPDKIRNKSDDEKKVLEENFVLITKAYKALTDEVTKENFEKYGNPDGPQPVTHGIALPKWLVEGSSTSLLLLGFYLFIIALVLPYIVSNWWSKTKSYTKRGIHTETASMFVEKLLNQKNSDIVRVKTILNILAHAEEYKIMFPSKTPEEIVELFNNYLNREHVNEEALKAVSLVPTLINGFVDIAATFRNLDLSTVAMQTMKHFVQALPENPKNELLQLPNVDPEAVKKSKVMRLGKLFTLPRDEMKTALGIQDDAKLDETLSVASKIPKLEIVNAKFKVPGESVVTPQATAHIQMKLIVRAPTHHGMTKMGKERFEDNDDELTHDHLLDPFKSVFEQPQLPLAYAPHFPEERQSGYIGLVVLQKDGKPVDAPVIIKNLSLENLELSDDEYKAGEKVVVGTFKLPMAQPTPKEVGKYHFRVIIKSLDYFTQDVDIPITMNVQEPPKLEEVSDYGIPVPKADTVDGALAAMRGEPVQDVSDDEDESEFEEEEDFTDINTDTEDESE